MFFDDKLDSIKIISDSSRDSTLIDILISLEAVEALLNCFNIFDTDPIEIYDGTEESRLRISAHISMLFESPYAGCNVPLLIAFITSTLVNLCKSREACYKILANKEVCLKIFKIFTTKPIESEHVQDRLYNNLINRNISEIVSKIILKCVFAHKDILEKYNYNEEEKKIILQFVTL